VLGWKAGQGMTRADGSGSVRGHCAVIRSPKDIYFFFGGILSPGPLEKINILDTPYATG
jgi:hypothetical protein